MADTPEGLTVTTVQDDSPANEVGIKAGDIITAVDGEAIVTTEQLRSVLRGLAPGTTVVIELTRDDEQLQLQVTLAERPTD